MNKPDDAEVSEVVITGENLTIQTNQVGERALINEPTPEQERESMRRKLKPAEPRPTEKPKYDLGETIRAMIHDPNPYWSDEANAAFAQAQIDGVAPIVIARKYKNHKTGYQRP